MIAILVAACATAEARPPTFAKAKKVALAWLRAAAKRTIPASTGAAITIAVHINECTGRWDRTSMPEAMDCVAAALAHASFSAHWTTDRLRLEVDMTIDAGGHVTAVDFGAAEIVEGF